MKNQDNSRTQVIDNIKNYIEQEIVKQKSDVAEAQEKYQNCLLRTAKNNQNWHWYFFLKLFNPGSPKRWHPWISRSFLEADKLYKSFEEKKQKLAELNGKLKNINKAKKLMEPGYYYTKELIKVVEDNRIHVITDYNASNDLNASTKNLREHQEEKPYIWIEIKNYIMKNFFSYKASITKVEPDSSGSESSDSMKNGAPSTAAPEHTKIHADSADNKPTP